MTDTPEIIKLDNVSFQYPLGIMALDQVSLSISTGERVGLAGHNGSGKSTLARHLNGLLLPSRGSVRIHGRDTVAYKVATLAGLVALMFQNPDNQICKRTVQQEIAFGPRNLGYPPDRTGRLVNGAMDLFALADLHAVNPYDLGYSLRKRVAMASIVAMDTPVIVLDEPTAGLDANEIRLVQRVLDQLQDRGKTVLVITHDMDFAAENIPRIICLAKGRKVYDGATQDFFNPGSLPAGSGVFPPQVVRLSASVGLKEPALTPRAFIRKLKRMNQ